MQPETSRDGGQHRPRRATEAPGARPVDRFTWERELRSSGLPFGTRGVLAILASYMNRDGAGARPSLATLADACGLQRRQLSNHLRPALELGWLARQSGRGPGSATSYAARLPQENGQSSAHSPQENGQPSARTKPSKGNGVPESGQPSAKEWAADCPPPSHDQDKTTLSPREEAPAVMIDPEQVRKEREHDLSTDADRSGASGAERIQSIAANAGADPAKWSEARQDRAGDHIARQLGPTAVPLIRPLLLELACSAGSIAANVDAYVLGILRKDNGADDVHRLAESGKRRMPKPAKSSPLDRLDGYERERLLADVEAELIDSGDVIPEWRNDSDRDHFERLIHHRAERLIRPRQPISA